MKAYLSYKASEYGWIGDIPSHWKIGKLKHFSQINPTKNPDLISKDSDELVTFLPMEKVNADGTYELSLKRPINELSSGFTYFELNDVIVAKITPCFENGKGALLSNLDGQIGFGSTEFHVLRALPEISQPKFLYYLTQSHLFKTTGEAFMYGAAGQKRVPTSHITDFPFSCPPLPEQQAIADFLDRKTAQIDTLIEKKQRQIDLLHEQRTALINHAVTKGLNPKVKMKDSGVEWLGEIPSHWEVIRLKHLLSEGLRNGIFKKKDDFGSGTKLVNVSDLYQDNYLVNYESLDRVQTNESEYSLFKVSSGDIFFVRSSLKLEGVGASVCITETPEPTVFECHVVKGSPAKEKINSLFLIYFLNSYKTRHKLVASAETVTMTTLRQSTIASLEIFVPPLNEQDKILEYINKENESFEKEFSLLRNQIALLQEYRTALISEAVTGKVDIR